MKGYRAYVAVALVTLVSGGLLISYTIVGWWPDDEDIVMDDLLGSTYSPPAQWQMAEWNYVDTTDNSHPFRINSSPEWSFGAADGDNTIGFLSNSELITEYGLTFYNAKAWTICWRSTSTGRYVECDVLIDVARPWSLLPDDDYWFQSTVIHELGHVRGLDHYDGWLSVMNVNAGRYLRGETLYADDRNAIREHATTVSERDITIYNKWNDGSASQWMSMSPTTVREGSSVTLSNISIENRGTVDFGSLRFGIYFSSNSTISTYDTLLNTGTFASFPTGNRSLFDWSAVIPSVVDCGPYYLGGIVDDNRVYSERYEDNNAVAFTDGVPYNGSSYTPTPLNVRLAEDPYEPNDSISTARGILLPFSVTGLSVDTDGEHDYYKVFAPSAGALSARLDFVHALGNLDLELLSTTGALLGGSYSTTDDESVVHHVVAGIYIIHVKPVGDGSCNRYALEVSFEPDPPDLVAFRLEASGRWFRGLMTGVIEGVRNDGGSAAGSFRCGLYLSTNTVCSTLDQRLTTWTVNGLAPGAISSGVVQFEVPASVPLGPQYLCLMADDQFVVSESDESNNTRYVPVTVLDVIVFADGFECGDCSMWSDVIGVGG